MNVEDSTLYELEFEERPNYLYAYISGDKDSVEICIQYWREIAAECQRTNYNKVLIVESIKETVSTTEMYEIASEIPNMMGLLGVKIAFVDRYIEQRPVNEFGGLVAHNRGTYVKLFDTVEEAEKWLLSN
ncbi:MAG: hypothetical protein WKF90_12955 [Pyrinomonadaceae bacterium]